METASGRDAQALQLSGIFIVLCAILWLFPRSSQQAQLSRLPILITSASSEERRALYLKNAYKFYVEGYQKVCSICFRGKKRAIGLLLRSFEMLFIACLLQMVSFSKDEFNTSFAECRVGTENLVIPPRLFHEYRKLTDSIVGFYPAAAKVGEERIAMCPLRWKLTNHRS